MGKGSKRVFEFDCFGNTYQASIGDIVTDGEDVCKVKRYRDLGYCKNLVIQINGTPETILNLGKRIPNGTKEDNGFKIVSEGGARMPVIAAPEKAIEATVTVTNGSDKRQAFMLFGYMVENNFGNPPDITIKLENKLGITYCKLMETVMNFSPVTITAASCKCRSRFILDMVSGITGISTGHRLVLTRATKNQQILISTAHYFVGEILPMETIVFNFIILLT